MLENYPQKCIVFGANGYIGRHLTYRLVEKGCDVRTFDISEESVLPCSHYDSIDLADIDALLSVDWNVDVVFMFAGITGTFAGFDNYKKYVDINEVGLLNVLDSIRKSGFRPRVIFPSTRLVYQGSSLPLTEDSPKEARTLYAVNKLACENILNVYSTVFKIEYTVYRICVPYGNLIGRDYSFGTVGAFLKQAINNAEITLYGDGSLRRTFTHIGDICDLILSSCQGPYSANRIFNVPGENCSLREVANLIARKYDADLKFIDWPENDLKIESGHTTFNGSLLQDLFRYQLSTCLGVWIDGLK